MASVVPALSQGASLTNVALALPGRTALARALYTAGGGLIFIPLRSYFVIFWPNRENEILNTIWVVPRKKKKNGRFAQISKTKY